MAVVEGVAAVEDVESFVDRLAEIGDEFGCAVQAFDARLVADREHLESAVAHARRSLDRGESVADDPAVEILLYAAGRRQIDRALAMGVSEGERPVAVVVDCRDGEADAGDEDREEAAAEAVRELLDPEPTVGGRADEAAIREFFEVTDAELGATDATLGELVRERVALLDVEK